MKLPFLHKKPTLPDREYFFALEIDHGIIKSAVWSVINGKSQVLSVGSTEKWDDLSEESLITACDKSLTEATTRLDSSGKIQPEKVILGLPVDWLDADKIKSERMKMLRSLTQQLSLHAVGFVVTPDAAIRYLQHSEGVPPNVVMIGVWSGSIEVALARLGKVDGVQVVKRSANMVADVIEGLSRFMNVDMFPSRILLYDSGMDLEDIRQQLLAHPWQSGSTKLHFLHFPKIEILPSEFSVRAISLAGGTEVAKAIGLIAPDTQLPPAEPAPSVPEMDAEPTPAAPSVAAPAPIPEVPLEELGFVIGEDITRMEEPEPDPTPASEPEPEYAVEVPRRSPFPEMTEDQIEKYNRRPAGPRVPFKLPAFSAPSLPKFGSLPLFIGLGVAAVVAGLGAAYWFLPKATITLGITPKTLSHQFQVVANTESSGGESGTIPARVVEYTATAEKSAATTGTKLVGERATGSVTLVNGTPTTKSFPAGTVLTSPSGLKFTTDESAQVASASGTADPNSYKPGQATVKVTASVIGAESNLSAGTQFRIGSFSTLDYVAKNDAALSGGSSRQVKAVSKEDVAGLRTETTQSVKDQAKNELSGQISPDDQLVAETITVSNPTEELSNKVDEEADEVTLRVTAKARGLVFAKSDINSLVTEQIKPQITEGYIVEGEPALRFTVREAKGTSVALVVDVSGDMVPGFNDQEIIQKVVGLSPRKATDYLSTLPGVSQVSFAFRPPLPTFILTLPHQEKNIGLITRTAQ